MSLENGMFWCEIGSLRIPRSTPWEQSSHGDSHMKVTGMLIILLRDANQGFWSNLGCSGQNANIFFTCEGVFQGDMERNKCCHCFDGLSR